MRLIRRKVRAEGVAQGVKASSEIFYMRSLLGSMEKLEQGLVIR